MTKRKRTIKSFSFIGISFWGTSRKVGNFFCSVSILLLGAVVRNTTNLTDVEISEHVFFNFDKVILYSGTMVPTNTLANILWNWCHTLPRYGRCIDVEATLLAHRVTTFIDQNAITTFVFSVFIILYLCVLPCPNSKIQFQYFIVPIYKTDS